MFLQNSSEALMTGVIGGVGSKLVFGNSVLNIDMPILDNLAGWDSAWLYFGVFAGANALQSYTGDFVAPYISNSQYFSKINKLSRPISTGVLAIAIMFVLNGFSINMMNAIYAGLLGGVSNVIGQWSANMIFPQRNTVLFQAQNIQSSIPLVPYVEQPKDVQMVSAPLVQNDLFGSNDIFGFAF